MRALCFDRQLTFRDDYPTPKPPPGEVLVRVRRAGICNTDLEITKGYQGFRGVPGHEFVGELPDGTRVVGEINAYDGTCETCRRGDVTHCEKRTVLGIVARDGAFAEYLALPTANLHRVPETIGDSEAVFVEPLAAALEITERVHIKPSDRVAVVGDGKLGLLCAQVLHLTGSDLVVVGRHPHKLEILKRSGVETTLAPESLRRKFDVVVECTGRSDGFDLARKLLQPRGVLVLKSTFHGAQELAMTPIVVDEMTIAGSRCGPFEPALRLLEKRLVDVKSLVDAEYPLDEGIAAFRRAQTPRTLKVQIVMGRR